MVTLNQEITGNRNDKPLSNALRTVSPYVRHIDVDMIQWNANYTQAEIVFESTSKHDYKSTKVARKIAANLGAFTILIKHKWLDDKHQHPVTVTLWYPDGTKHEEVDELVMTWEGFKDLCKQIHEYYLPELQIN